MPNTHTASIVWFRQDLRLQDNAALQNAIAAGRPVIPLYIWDPEAEGDWPIGSASKWWLHHALVDLQEQLQENGLPLIIRRGNTEEQLRSLIASHNVQAIYCNRRYEPAPARRDEQLAANFIRNGVEFWRSNSNLLFDPSNVRNKSDKPFLVFTPFYKYLLTLDWPAANEVDLASAHSPLEQPYSLPLESLELLPKIPWAKGFSLWTPTRAGALAQLQTFAREAAANYQKTRDNPAIEGTSRLSPSLHFGQIGPREVLAAVTSYGGEIKSSGYLRQLIWREFGHHLLHHYPQTDSQPLRPEFKQFPWQDDEALLKAWQQGRTGIPLVDAGMRELWATGWMHNRVRMNVASYLVKHLLVPWQRGAEWFWDTLVDADLANNTLGWQWTAGCGADAAPYFRVFNPATQAGRFDADGAYIRKWVPELAKLQGDALFDPASAPPLELLAANIRLGKDYPLPITGLSEGRQRALAAFDTFKAKIPH